MRVDACKVGPVACQLDATLRQGGCLFQTRQRAVPRPQWLGYHVTRYYLIALVHLLVRLSGCTSEGGRMLLLLF